MYSFNIRFRILASLNGSSINWQWTVASAFNVCLLEEFILMLITHSKWTSLMSQAVAWLAFFFFFRRPRLVITMATPNTNYERSNSCNNLLHFFLYPSLTTQSVLRQVHTSPKRVFQGVRSRTSAFNSQYLLSLRSSSSCLRFLSRHPVTSILPCIFPAVTCFRR